ncbi:pseudouridine synthase [Deminuibacter soli]|uniref:Pseudouridine synthase n=1 Tax=Deminuibacter soli TaxID=2291815 RepID=A0A3E1NNW8_9BACT|nr:pseudouridine synthase [Deminuibacter soli]RFM29629.1 rRNA pseudouridine synthase [Deminuibacter soli]
MSNKQFEKFINKNTGAHKKEAIRQEKRQVKAELRAQGEEARKRNEDKYREVTPRNKPSASPKPSTPLFNGKPLEQPLKPARVKKEAPKKQGGAAFREFPAASASISKAAASVQKKEKPEAPAPQAPAIKSTAVEGEMPLNKYIAHAGICGRREAADLVKEGKVTVNGDKIFEPGFKVTEKDKVTVKGKQVFLQKNAVYILINKPKDYITTAKDPEGRKTVLDLLKGATQERIYPVGRLDRNTTGVLIMTNDGELAQKLTHPSYEIKKVYEVRLDKPVTKKDMDAIVNGITLEDGFITADSVGYADAKDKSVVGIEIHSGRNRIVRRIFEHLGYTVKNLDRVMFANLTKKNVDRGKWRYLNEKEVRLLKYMNQSFVRKKGEA